MSQLKTVYFALDFETGIEAVQFLKKHRLEGIPVKVGMELFYREGAEVINQLKQQGHDIFLDLKLHDIPETVRRSMRNIAKLEVDVVNVHAQGGKTMMRAAKEGLEEGAQGKRPVLLAVTMLTSSDQTMVEEELLLSHKLPEVVRHFAEIAEKSGMDGVVCSVEEAELVKTHTNLLTLTPGIRLNGGETHDQKRVATPEVANEKGSDAIVVGRAIREADDPAAAYEQIKEAFHNEEPTTHQ
ncbi:orotidine-5'-phosphate decarboxylase [Halobacillus litoralis]|uniref:Orotidine 5'-phosphate decarboxylase n=1 Tax=Halobacillus litoralis TaxID=45668 RepID=A0A410M8N2_9BACI|nr:orotidine-5'-phosphate decarboxylase [Halobacillus litoralis]QAS51069.1 orotidine-5'-phosphate decarboxylase [Halobacillus litoralis]